MTLKPETIAAMERHMMEQTSLIERLCREKSELRSEIDRLRAERDDYKDALGDSGKLNQVKDKEIARLRANPS